MIDVAPTAPANRTELNALAQQGEGQALEFKRSTGELREGLQTVCAFLNGAGGTVLFGVRPDGGVEGQQVSDQTLHEIAQAAERFEPPAHVSIHRIEVQAGREVIAVAVASGRDVRPFTYEGRAYERVSSTTRRMPQAKYEKLLLDRAHGTRRWETEPAEGISLRDIDRAEVFRIIEAARAKGHLQEPVGSRLPGILDRLEVRKEGRILQAAVVLFGKRFLPDYAQCELRMARFRGWTRRSSLTNGMCTARPSNYWRKPSCSAGGTSRFLAGLCPANFSVKTGRSFRLTPCGRFL